VRQSLGSRKPRLHRGSAHAGEALGVSLLDLNPRPPNSRDHVEQHYLFIPSGRCGELADRVHETKPEAFDHCERQRSVATFPYPCNIACRRDRDGKLPRDS